MLLALVPDSAAVTVAILDFDAYGVPHDDAAFVTEQIRDALLAGGTLDPVSATELADAVTRNHEDALRRAREAFASGRARWTAGNADGAAADFERAVALHFEARSDLARHAELADAGWMLAVARDGAGDPDGARDALSTLAGVFPGYASTRATLRPPAVVARFAEVEAARLRAQPRRWAETALADLESALSVDLVVTGAVRSDGRVSVRIYDEGVVLGEASAMLATSPPALFDPAFESVASGIVSAATGDRAPDDGTPVVAAARVPVSDVSDASDASDGAATAPESTERARPSTRATDDEDARPTTRATDDEDARSTSPPRVVTPRARDVEPGPRAPSRTTRVTSVREVPTARPVNERWWFWALLLAATSGAGAAVGAWMYEPRPVVQEVPDTWAVRVDTP